VSGGDVLVRIHLARNFSLRHLSIELNGTNVADQFRSDAGGRSATGLLSGLRDGQNLL
jgi:hypothetical protein